MINILVVNSNSEENYDWVIQLKKHGYNVLPGCTDLSAMVKFLSQEIVDVAICSTNLVGENAVSILTNCTKFFPRVKIILIGGIANRQLLLKLQDVVVRNEFGTDISKYLNRPVFAPDKTETKKTMDQLMTLLLGDHFLSNVEATDLLKAIEPSWTADYAIVSILTNSYATDIFKIVKSFEAELKFSYVLHDSINEICIIFEGSPPKNYLLNASAKIQNQLLKWTQATFSIGISRERSFVDELYACRKEAVRAASASTQFGKNSVVHIDYVDNHDLIYVYPYHKEKKLVELILDGDINGANKILEEIFEILWRKSLSIQNLKKIAESIIISLDVAAVSKSRMFQNSQFESLELSKYQNAGSFEEINLLLKKAIEDVSSEMKELQDVHMDAVFYKLMSLKKENAAKPEKERVSISDLPIMLNTTVYFLNQAIKKNTGSNIFEFFDNNM